MKCIAAVLICLIAIAMSIGTVSAITPITLDVNLQEDGANIDTSKLVTINYNTEDAATPPNPLPVSINTVDDLDQDNGPIYAWGLYDSNNNPCTGGPDCKSKLYAGIGIYSAGTDIVVQVEGYEDHTFSSVTSNVGPADVDLTPTGTTAPSTPTLNDPGTTDTDGSYTVSWNSVSSATSYTLEEDTSSSFGSPTVVHSGVGTSKDVSGKSDGMYYYRVQACNAEGCSGWSNVEDIEVSHEETAPSVTVLYPNGGESIPIGTQVQVSARAADDNAVTSVTFYYSTGTNWNSIGAGTRVFGTAKDGTWNITWDTNGLSAGTNYKIKAVASDGTSTREDQSNSAFSLIGTQPDLIIQDVSWSPENPKEGDDLTFTVVVKNQGSCTAGTFFVYFYIDDTLVVYYEVSSLSAGTTATRSFQGPPTNCGNIQVRVVADATNVITESNEGNNELSEIVSIICPGEPVHNIDTGENFATIQAAINDSDTQDGHTITVDARTYYEHVVIDKSLNLIGANKGTTIIDGSGNGKCVHVTADSVEIRGFTIKNGLYGIYLESSNDTIKNNRVSDHCEGIYLYNSNNNLITHNIITNTTFFFSGIHLSSSNGNVISDNDIFENYDGIYLYNSNNNLIYHNNLRDNTKQAYDNVGTNSWDNGAAEGGNCWSDHSSCIGDPSDGSQPYYIDSEGVDHYPFQDQNGWSEENIAPVASFSYSPLNPVVGQTVAFDLSSSYDPDGQIVSYHLSFGDGAEDEGAWPTIGHSYSYAGNYTITLTVTDDGGATDTTSKVVRVASQGGNEFDTRQSDNPYPSLSGTHNGTITPTQTIEVNWMYTYPCEGTGGHSEYVAFFNVTTRDEIANGTWNGYDSGNYSYITFDVPFELTGGVTYNYEIRTGSYPQILHQEYLQNSMGNITCSEFTDVNGVEYDNWMPAIRLGQN